MIDPQTKYEVEAYATEDVPDYLHAAAERQIADVAQRDGRSRA